MYGKICPEAMILLSNQVAQCTNDTNLSSVVIMSWMCWDLMLYKFNTFHCKQFFDATLLCSGYVHWANI